MRKSPFKKRMAKEHENEEFSAVKKQKLEITHEEAAQYDRQIRLWGFEAQNRYVL